MARDRLVHPVIGAPHALQQPRHALRRADLDHLVHAAPVDAEIERRGRHHGAQLAARHRRLDAAALLHLQRAVVQRDRQRRLVQPPQRLEHQLRLGARVDEHDRHAGRADARHHPGRGLQAHVAGPGQFAFRQHHRQFRRRAVRLLDHPARRRHRRGSRAGCATVADSPTRRQRRRQRHQPRRRTAPTGRRAWCRRARAPRPSPRRRARRTSPAHPAATAAPPGFPAWSAGCSAAATRWRARRLAGVSPVRVSIDTASRISSTGRVRLRAMSVASAFSGLTYSVCRPARGASASSTRVGRKPGQRLAAAGRRDQQHAFAGARGIQHRQLVLSRRPSLRGEPAGKGFRQCSGHAGCSIGSGIRRKPRLVRSPSGAERGKPAIGQGFGHAHDRVK